MAADAGVALSTASIILSENSVYLRNFSQDTIRRVRKSADKLGYRPSLFASSLPTKGASIFFLVALHDVHAASSADRFLWGFDGDILGGVTETALSSRVYPIIALAQPCRGESDLDNIDRIVGGGVFGAIVRTPSGPVEKRLRHYLREGRPVVVVFPKLISKWRMNSIDVDNVAMGQRAGQLLARQGRNRWLIVMDTDDCEPHALRLRGFKACAKREGATLEVVSCSQQLDYHQASARLAPFIKKIRPDGVFALTSRTAEGVLDACEKTGVRMSQDLLLVGCDCSVWRTALRIQITSLEASWRQAGELAMRNLLEMREMGTARCPRVLMEPVLVPGETCPLPELESDKNDDAGDSRAAVAGRA